MLNIYIVDIIVDYKENNIVSSNVISFNINYNH